MHIIKTVVGKLVFKLFFKVISVRRIEKHLQHSQGYSRTGAREIISNFKKASLMSISQRD
jgi:hypothetical protein